ncbi:MAG: 4-demethylwyosine synthase TYW1 [Thermoproteales archaeon]|nr:4-demethylwyosine synthase TYW1 [Thermoproteales archaeon]
MSKLRFDKNVAQRYLRAGYRLVGRHSAVEICRWTKSALKGERLCYKRWYGVRSHRCVQMTPNLNFCNFACVFCWRMHLPGRFKLPEGWEWDKPEDIIEGAIQAQRELLIGFKGHPRVTRERFLEAMFPRHMAISLDGEPALYPYLAELVKKVKERGMTAYVVTNGSVPYRLQEMLKKDAQPTNLYISVYGPDEETFRKAARPLIPNAWESVQESLELLPKFSTRTIIRLTMVRGLNMVNPEGYARLIEKAQPRFFELKGYTWVGESQKRLPISAMPTIDELRELGDKIAEKTGYLLKEMDSKSRVVMYVRDEETWEWNLKLVEEWRKLEEKLDREQWKGKITDFKLKKR